VLKAQFSSPCNTRFLSRFTNWKGDVRSECVMRHDDGLAHGPFPLSPPHLHPNAKDLASVSQGIFKPGLSQLREGASHEADAGFGLLSCQRHKASQRQTRTSRSPLSTFAGGHIGRPATGPGKPPLYPWLWGTLCPPKPALGSGAGVGCSRPVLQSPGR